MAYKGEIGSGQGRGKAPSWGVLYPDLPVLDETEWDRNTHWGVDYIADVMGVGNRSATKRIKSRGVEPIALVKASKGRHTVKPLYDPEDVRMTFRLEGLDRRRVNEAPQRRAPSQRRMVRGTTAAQRSESVDKTLGLIRQGVVNLNERGTASNAPTEDTPTEDTPTSIVGTQSRIRIPRAPENVGVTRSPSNRVQTRITIPRVSNVQFQKPDDGEQISLF